jgi:hypothetical protein
MFLRTGAKVMSTSLIDKLNRFYYDFIVCSFTQTFTLGASCHIELVEARRVNVDSPRKLNLEVEKASF